MNTAEQVDKIRKIAWALSVASAENKLDTPGEFVWAYPKNNQFWEIRSRERSIFSSGNAIKDQDVIDFVQNINCTKYLKDPWTVSKFEEQFPSWIDAGSRYKLRNFDLFKFSNFSQGTQESFLNYYIMNKDRRLRVFKGDYWWHMEIWTRAGFNWSYLEDDDIKPGDACICSYPFALTGEKNAKFDWLLDECDRVGAKCLVDFIYLPNSNNVVDIDLARPCIEEITFSLSKTFPVQTAKLAIRLLKTKPYDPMQMSNDENIGNRLSAGLALELINQFPVDYMVSKYSTAQDHWCNALGLSKTNVVHFALGPDYTNYGREINLNWCSPFNEQQNRYNLGMLFENENLLKKLQLY
jgi:hypothetical protein